MTGPRELDLDQFAPSDLFDRLVPSPQDVARCLSTTRLAHRVAQMEATEDEPQRLIAYRAEIGCRGGADA